MEKFAEIFQSKLPPGLPPEQSTDYVIETEPNAKPPNRPILQLSPAELLETQEHVVDWLSKGKIRQSRSPHGAPLFFVKQKGKTRGVIYYGALKRITKPNKTPIWRPDGMFDRLGPAKCF